MPYQLLLNQLVYTSFTTTGFRTIASATVPVGIQQAFIEHVVSKNWDSYTVQKSEYRAVYLYQVTPEHNLFGWLYNDGDDEIGRSDVPYFHCYYLAEPLLFYFQLASIFNCLHKGPVALIDRHSLPETLETVVVGSSSYQSARPGVAIPSIVRARSHISLKQGELLDLFVPIDAEEVVVELNEPTQEQQITNFSIYTRYLVEGIESGAVDLNQDTATITAKVIKSYQGYTKKLQQYEKGVVSAIQREHPLTDSTRNSLKLLQQNLKLRSEDIESAEARALIEVSSFNSSHKSIHHNYVSPHKNSQLLLKVGIVATALVLSGGLIYGLVHRSKFALRQPELIPPARPVFYTTFAEVPNVPEGLFNYGGSTTWAPLRSELMILAINQAHPRFQLRYTEPVTGPGSGKGIKMLLEQQLSIAQSSRPVKNEEFEQAKDRGFTLEQVPVAIDGIAVYVNPKLSSLKGLTISQLKAIFTGKIKNWKALGGPDVKITPFSRNLSAGGTVDFFYEEVLDKETFGSGVQEVRDTTESIRKVSITPGGIGYATTSQVVSQSTIYPLPLSRGANQPFVAPFASAKKTVVNKTTFGNGSYLLTSAVNKTAFSNGSYPLTRRLFVIIKRDGRLDEEAGIAYANLLLTDEGQRLMNQAGFVPIR